MAENETTDTTNSDVSANSNDKEVSTGNEQDIKNPVKTFTQEEVNQIVKQRIAENTAKTKKDVEKHYEGKIIFDSEDAFNAKLKEHADTALEMHKRETALTTKRTEFKAKGLTDAQLDIVAEKSSKIEDFDKVAETYFGALLKKEAPIINPGNTQKNESSTDVDDLIGKSLEAARNRNK